MLLLWPTRGSDAALGIGDIVFDPTNYIENLATAVNTWQTMRNTFTVIENQIKDLERLTGYPASPIGGTLGQVLTVLHSLQGAIPYDIDQVIVIFNMLYPTGAALPCTSTALSEWRTASQTHRRTALLDAMRVQGLLGRLGDLSGLMMAVFGQLVEIAGNVRGQQVLAQYQSMIIKEQTRLSTMNGVFERAVTNEKATMVTEEAILDCIAQRISEPARLVP